MYELIKLFFDICLLKKGPEDIPVSSWLLRILIFAYACISLLILLLSVDLYHAILQAVVEIILILVSSWCILFLAKKLMRFKQTVSALMATGVLISLFSLPAMATLIGAGTTLSIISIVLLMLWSWVVSGHIYSKALDQAFSFGLGIAFLYILLSFQVMAFLFPVVVNS